MRNLGALTVFARAGGLAVAVVLFVIAIFSDSAWQELSGIGLAMVAIVMFFDALRRRRGAGALVKLVALAAAALFFVLAALVNTSNSLDMFALGFILLTLSVIADHLTDFAAVRAALAAAADHQEASSPAAAAAPAPTPPAPAPAATEAAGKCAKCGEPLKADERFCTSCGAARA